MGSKTPKRMDIESKLQPLCTLISSNLQNNANGVSRHEFNNKLHEWILLPANPHIAMPSNIKTKTTVASSFMSLTPSSTQSFPSNNTMLIQSHSLNTDNGFV